MIQPKIIRRIMNLENKTILIVDDSSLIRDRLCLLLTNLRARILLAGGFDEAAFLLETEQIDIVLLDIHLNDRNGIDLLRVIKHLYPEIYVMMVTNEANPQTQALCQSIGANAFIDKSNEFTKIRGIVSSLV